MSIVSNQSSEREKLLKAVSAASVATAIILIAVKVLAWAKTDSVSLLATLVDSSLDLLASMVNLWAIRRSLRPATREYRFGQGKVEAIAGLGQSMFVMGSAMFLLLESGRRLFDPAPVMMLGYGLAVVIFSVLLTSLLVAFQVYVIKKTQSPAIKADALHYKTDLLVNVGVLVALVLTSMGWIIFDALIALAIAIYILASARIIARDSAQHLLDHELSDEERLQIRDRVLSHPDVLGMHDLRTRRSGGMIFIQLHLELDDHLELLKAHAIADTVEQSIMQVFPNSEVIIHEDPLGAVDQDAVSERFVSE